MSRWLCKKSSKNMFVKIVHPGGHVELHDRPILAAELLERNPKCCVAHPTVFQQPHAAVVSPEATLLLGRKYYVVPLGTIRKLRLKHRRAAAPLGTEAEAEGTSSSPCWLFRNGRRNIGEERNNLCHTTPQAHSHQIREDAAANAESSPGRMPLLSTDNWQPGLHSICEEE